MCIRDRYIFGYTVVNDVSARNLQTAHNQWYFGKSLDEMCIRDSFTSFLLLWALCSLPRDVPRHARAVSRLSFGLYLSHLLVLRLWIEWTTRRPKVMYLRFGQLWLLVFAGGLLIASVLAILPHGSLLGGAPCKNTKQTEGQNGEKT